jgi:hypothetical protein
VGTDPRSVLIRPAARLDGYRQYSDAALKHPEGHSHVFNIVYNTMRKTASIPDVMVAEIGKALDCGYGRDDADVAMDSCPTFHPSGSNDLAAFVCALVQMGEAVQKQGKWTEAASICQLRMTRMTDRSQTD